MIADKFVDLYARSSGMRDTLLAAQRQTSHPLPLIHPSSLRGEGKGEGRR